MKKFVSSPLRLAALTLAALSMPLHARAATLAPFRVATPQFTVFLSGQTPGFSAGKSPSGIVAARDGTVWFTELTGIGGTPGIAKITAAGKVTEYPTGTYESSRPLAIVAGVDKNLWYADAGARAIGRLTPQGRRTSFQRGLSKGDVPVGIANGNDGSMWFVSDGQGPYVGKVDIRGIIVEVAHLDSSLRADPSLGVDRRGNVYLTGANASNEVLIRVDPAGHVKTRVLPLQPGFNPCCVYETTQSFATRRDGSLWFTNLFYVSNKNGSHPLGDIDDDAFRLSYDRASFIGSIARGPGNDLWFANQDPFYANASIGTVGPKGGLRVFPMPFDLSPLAITVAPNGTLWMSGTSGSGVGAVIRATP